LTPHDRESSGFSTHFFSAAPLCWDTGERDEGAYFCIFALFPIPVLWSVLSFPTLTVMLISGVWPDKTALGKPRDVSLAFFFLEIC